MARPRKLIGLDVPITDETLSREARGVIARFAHDRRPVLWAHPHLTVREFLYICERHEWDADAAARALGVGRATLWRCLKRLGISLREEKKGVPERRYGRNPNWRHVAGIHETILDA